MSFLAKKAPVWAVILSALAATGVITVAFMALPALSDATQASRDFSISTSPSPVTVEQGSTATSTITITSLSSFDLATGLTTTLTPPTSLLTVSLNPSIVTPPANSKTTSTVTITSLPGTPVGTYTVTLTATGGTKSHTSTLTIIVATVPDFSIASSLTSLIVYQNAANSTTLTLTSLGSFSGDVSLTVTAPFATLGVAGGQSPLHLAAGGANTTTLGAYASSQTPPGAYTITVTGTSGNLAHTLSIPVTVKSGAIGCGPLVCITGREALSLETYFFSSPTNVTLYLRNFGTANLTMVSYYVKDPAGDQYVNLAWNGPTINVNAVAGARFLIGSSCPNCTLVGSPFTFTGGNSYTITIVTARNNQFTFTVISSNPIESLSLAAYSFPSGTNATLYLRNTGSASVTLTTYYVQDTSGNTYARTTWSGATISTNSTVPVSILIGPSCSPNCSLTGSPFNFTSGHSYTVTLATANSNWFAFTVADSIGLESLNLESLVFTSSTNVTLYLRNTGSTSISLIAYYVTDTSNDTYARTPWTGPAITASSVVPVSFLIGSSCANCSLTGTAFTFTPGNTFTITLVTARNNTFRFTVTR